MSPLKTRSGPAAHSVLYTMDIPMTTFRRAVVRGAKSPLASLVADLLEDGACHPHTALLEEAMFPTGHLDEDLELRPKEKEELLLVGQRIIGRFEGASGTNIYALLGEVPEEKWGHFLSLWMLAACGHGVHPVDDFRSAWIHAERISSGTPLPSIDPFTMFDRLATQILESRKDTLLAKGKYR